MKIRVTRGEVPIRNVVVKSHLERRIYSVTIATPLDRNPIVTLGSMAASGEKLGRVVELFRPRRSAGQFDPSTVLLVPESPREEFAMQGGLHEIDWSRWSVTLLAIAPDVLSVGNTVESWEEFAGGGADYIEGGG